jgi:hypothetical protein
MSEEEAYDHGFHDGLATAWQLMFSQVLGAQREFLDVLKELANLRNAARADAERHQMHHEEDQCTCVNDEINVNCTWCF